MAHAKATPPAATAGPHRPHRLMDTQGVVYIPDTLLGQGGQGEVWSITGGRVAIKRYSSLIGLDPKQRRRLEQQLAAIRRFPLEGLPLARPLVLLKAPELGYVMERLTGMIPFQHLLEPQGNDPLAHWLETGGLKRRLLLLAEAAEVLATLHEKGLVYGDLSPNNLYVSERQDRTELRLIDLDNLRIMADPSDACRVYTPSYGAPEVVRGMTGGTSLSDAWSLAVITFQALTLLHPLIGDAVSDGPPELEESALRGEMPWIDDPDDASNQHSGGLPRSVVLSKGLQGLAQQTFGPGRLDVSARPGVRSWAEKLYAAWDACLSCAHCPASFYLNAPCCPFCDGLRPEALVVRVSLWMPEQRRRTRLSDLPSYQAAPDRPDWKRMLEPLKVIQASRTSDTGQVGSLPPDGKPQSQDEVFLPARITRAATDTQAQAPDVAARLTGGTLELRAVSEQAKQFCLERPEGGYEPLRSGWRRLPSGRFWPLHCGDPNQQHPYRVLHFSPLAAQ